MLSQRFLPIICVFLFLSVFASSLYLSPVSSQQKKKIYYLPSLESLKLISGNFRPLFAEALFIKGVLELSEPIPGRMDYLLKLFGTSIGLDPKLISAYFFGGVVVPRNEEEIASGIKFLKQGLKLNSSNWKIPFWLGFNYLQLGNYAKAAEYYRIAANLPDSPNYLKTNLAFFYYKSNRAQQGLLYLEGLLHSLKDKRVLAIIERKIEWLKGLTFLEKKVAQYKLLYGIWPSELKDLVKVNLIKQIPEDRFGKGYYLEKGLLESPKIRSRF